MPGDLDRSPFGKENFRREFSEKLSNPKINLLPQMYVLKGMQGCLQHWSSPFPEW